MLVRTSTEKNKLYRVNFQSRYGATGECYVYSELRVGKNVSGIQKQERDGLCIEIMSGQ